MQLYWYLIWSLPRTILEYILYTFKPIKMLDDRCRLVAAQYPL